MRIAAGDDVEFLDAAPADDERKQPRDAAVPCRSSISTSVGRRSVKL
jgi:hypothetical protein